MRPLLLAVGALLLLLACKTRPQEPGEPWCDAECEAENARFFNRDVIVRSPGLWHFFDAVGDRIEPSARCEPVDAGVATLTPLWRRTIVAESRDGNALRSGGSRNAIAVNNGRLAVNLGGYLWILDAYTGEPLHIFDSAGWDAGEVGVESVPFGQQAFAAFTPDHHGLWIYDQGGPALFNLEKTQPPMVTYSWYWNVVRPQGSPVRVDIWNYASPVVGPDGTLFWKSATGAVRALETSGRLRWEVDVRAGGHSFFLPNGSVFYSNGQPPQAVDPLTGAVTLRLPPPAGATGGVALEVERAYRREFLPVDWYSLDGGSESVVAAHRISDGYVAWTRSLLRLNMATGQALDGTVYLTSSDRGSVWTTEKGVVEALDLADGHTRFRLELPVTDQPDGGPRSSAVSVGPIPSAKHMGLYVVTENCQVHHIDETGRVRKSFSMAGPPTGHVPQLHDGVLYVLADASLDALRASMPRDQWCPRDFSSDPKADYGCMSVDLCWPCIRLDPYYLYAFAVE